MKKKCFVIMPFGIKETIDFDAVYRTIIKPAIERADLESVRSDDIEESGIITQRVADAISVPMPLWLIQPCLIPTCSTNSACVMRLNHALRS